MTNIYYKDEKEFLDRIESFLKNNNIKTWREVVPDQHKNRELPFKVDLIFYSREFGYVGVEGKNTHSLRSGGIIAEAVEQVQKYRNLTYFEGNKINTWAIAVPLRCAGVEDTEFNRAVILEVKTYIQHFLNKIFDISLLEFKDYSNKEFNKVIFGKIKIGGKKDDTGKFF